MISFGPLTPRQFGPILADLRDIDKRECAAVDVTPKQALRFGMTHGDAAVVFDDGQPVATFGVVPLSLATGSAVVWMLATNAAVGRAREWLTAGRIWVEILRRQYPGMKNRVHRDNRLAIRWLSRIGFEVDPETDDSEFRDFRLCAIQ